MGDNHNTHRIHAAAHPDTSNLAMAYETVGTTTIPNAVLWRHARTHAEGKQIPNNSLRWRRVPTLRTPGGVETMTTKDVHCAVKPRTVSGWRQRIVQSLKQTQEKERAGLLGALTSASPSHQVTAGLQCFQDARRPTVTKGPRRCHPNDKHLIPIQEVTCVYKLPMTPSLRAFKTAGVEEPTMQTLVSAEQVTAAKEIHRSMLLDRRLERKSKQLLQEVQNAPDERNFRTHPNGEEFIRIHKVRNVHQHDRSIPTEYYAMAKAGRKKGLAREITLTRRSWVTVSQVERAWRLYTGQRPEDRYDSDWDAPITLCRGSARRPQTTLDPFGPYGDVYTGSWDMYKGS